MSSCDALYPTVSIIQGAAASYSPCCDHRYNGCTYRRGSSSSTLFKVHPDSVVKVSVDMDIGTMSYAIDGGSPSVAFTDVKGPIWPAVAFYGSNRSVEMLTFESDSTDKLSGDRIVSLDKSPQLIGQLVVDVDKTGRIIAKIADAFGKKCSVTSAAHLDAAEWTHVGIVSRKNSLAVYMNGHLQGVSAYSDGCVAKFGDSTPSSVKISSDGRTVKSIKSGKSYSLVDYPVFPGTVKEWEFTIDVDVRA